MTDYHINWSSELEKARTFLADAGGVLHVRADSACMPSQFLNVLAGIAQQVPLSRLVAKVEPHNQLTASPLAALKEIFRVIGASKPFAPPQQHLSVTVASDVHAWFGSVTVENVHVYVGSISEAEEIGALIRLLDDEIDGGRRFDDLLVVFSNCDSMSSTLRRDFHHSIWQPALEKMVDLGAHVVFQYSSSDLAVEGESLPAMSPHMIDLPRSLVGMQDEFAELALRLSWEREERDALVLARGILETSHTVEALYAAMAMLMMRKGSAS
ncbi:hypothetical protein JOF42_000518 [Microbacterium phyllosphaerae]|uniref:Uncharacterized protein n=1 Tax=Microbacterium phyllosphaerae TaxID=124798 RepID=A0ABS4WLE1_9MICO|nr:hypothetical protein [Microbacterium phyllosphaerae]MBP2377023.1 hypothetical protein [Microbacterium phyllosphaerae]